MGKELDMSKCGVKRFRNPRDRRVRNILGFSFIVFALGMSFSMLICWRMCQWIVIVFLIGLGIWLLLQE